MEERKEQKKKQQRRMKARILTSKTHWKGGASLMWVFFAKKLKCTCGESLHLEDIQSERRIGLVSTYAIQCRTCLQVVQVPTSKMTTDTDLRTKLYDTNSKAVIGTLDAGLGCTHLNKVLTCMNIPPFHNKLFQKHEKIVGAAMEDVAKKSCLDVAMLERSLTISNIDNIQNMLPKDLQSDFIVPEVTSCKNPTNNESLDPLPSLSCNDNPQVSSVQPDLQVADQERKVRVGVSYDMGYSKRGTGKNYDSLNGFGAFIGCETGKVVAYGTRNRQCRLCDLGHDKSDHDCRLNFKGSAKAMEADLAAELASESSVLKEANIEVGILVGDDDSCTIKAVRAVSDHPVVKLSDKNHTVKGVTKYLYAIKNSYKELTVDAIKYLGRCFSYAIAQNKGDAVGMALAIRQIPNHAFNQHEHCGEWCGYIRDKENYNHSAVPGGFTDPGLMEKLTILFENLTKSIHKFVHGSSSQANESLNGAMSHKAPKNRCYSLSQSADYRFANVVGNKNQGASYIQNVQTALGHSPGKHTVKFLEQYQRKKEKRRLEAQTKTFKNRRNTLKKSPTMLRHKRENNEGVTYESGMNLFEADAFTSSCSDNSAAEAIVFFDLETSGLSLHAEILQIGARYENTSFGRYINPTQPITPAAAAVNGLTNQNGVLFLHGSRVTTLPLRIVLAELQQFLVSVGRPCVLVAHNCSFDSTRLIQAIQKMSMLHEFVGIIKGFTDTLLIFRELLQRRGQCSQSYLAAEHLKISNAGAHDAVRDVEVLQMLVKHFEISDHTLIEKQKSFRTLLDAKEASVESHAVEKTLSPLIGVISPGTRKKMGSSKICFNMLIDTYVSDGDFGVIKLLTELVDGKPRITKSAAIIEALLDFLKSII